MWAIFVRSSRVTAAAASLCRDPRLRLLQQPAPRMWTDEEHLASLCAPALGCLLQLLHVDHKKKKKNNTKKHQSVVLMSSVSLPHFRVINVIHPFARLTVSQCAPFICLWICALWPGRGRGLLLQPAGSPLCGGLFMMPPFKFIPMFSSSELQWCKSQIPPKMEELPNPSTKFNVMDTGGVGGSWRRGYWLDQQNRLWLNGEMSLL